MSHIHLKLLASSRFNRVAYIMDIGQLDPTNGFNFFHGASKFTNAKTKLMICKQLVSMSWIERINVVGFFVTPVVELGHKNATSRTEKSSN